VYAYDRKQLGKWRNVPKSLAQSKAHDKTFMDWLANYFRQGPSPKCGKVLTKMNTEVDIIDILGSIRVPGALIYATDGND